MRRRDRDGITPPGSSGIRTGRSAQEINN